MTTDDVFSYTENDSAENTTLAKDLDEFIDLQEIAGLGLDPDNIPEIDITRDQAEYYLKTYKNLARQKKEFEEIHDTKVREYTKNADLWLENKLKPLTSSMEFFENALRDYASNNLAANKKSIPMFEGTLCFTKQQPSYNREDEKIRNFLKETDGGDKYLDTVPEKIAWSALKKDGKIVDNIFTFNGKAVNGVTISIVPDKFTIK